MVRYDDLIYHLSVRQDALIESMLLHENPQTLIHRDFPKLSIPAILHSCQG